MTGAQVSNDLSRSYELLMSHQVTRYISTLFFTLIFRAISLGRACDEIVLIDTYLQPSL